MSSQEGPSLPTNSDRRAQSPRGLAIGLARRRWVLAIVIAVVACGAIVMFCRPSTLVSVLESIGVQGVVAVLGLYGLNQFLRAIRIWIALPSRADLSLVKVVGIVSVHQCLNHLLPLRIGEAGFPVLFKRYTTLSAASATSLLLVVRIQEMFVLAGAFLCSLALTVAGTHAGIQTGWLVAAALCIIAAIAAFQFLLPHLTQVAARLCRSDRIQWIGTERLARLGDFLGRLRGELTVRQSPALRAASWTITVGVWACTFLISQVALNSAGMKISFVDTVLGTTVASVSHVLPINALGSFGSLEAGWTLGFTLVGLDPRSTLAVGFILHLLALLFLIVTAAVSWFMLESRLQDNGTTRS